MQVYIHSNILEIFGNINEICLECRRDDKFYLKYVHFAISCLSGTGIRNNILQRPVIVIGDGTVTVERQQSESGNKLWIQYRRFRMNLESSCGPHSRDRHEDTVLSPRKTRDLPRSLR